MRGGVVALLCAAVLAGCPTSTPAPPSADPSVRRLGDGKRVLNLDGDIASEVATAAVRRHPDTFAGAWTDASGAVHVAFTVDAIERTEQLAPDFPTTRLVGEQVRFTLAELQAAATAAREQLRAAQAQVTFVSVDVDDNRVLVVLAPGTDEDDRADVEAVVDHEAIVVEHVDSIEGGRG